VRARALCEQAIIIIIYDIEPVILGFTQSIMHLTIIFNTSAMSFEFSERDFLSGIDISAIGGQLPCDLDL